MSKISFYDAIYHVEYIVIIGDIKIFNNEARKLNKEHKDETGDAKCLSVFEKTNKIIIYLREANIPSLAHECCHAGISVFDMIGAKVNLETDENFAYYLQFLIGTIFHNFKEFKKPVFKYYKKNQ